MDESESLSLEAFQVQQKRQTQKQNDNLEEEEEDDDDDDDDDEEGSQFVELNQPVQSQQLVELSSSQLDQLRESQLKPLLVRPSTAILPENDQCVGSQGNLTLKKGVETKFKVQDGVSDSEVCSAVTQGAESQAPNQLQSSQYPTLSDFSPTSVTQLMSLSPCPILAESALSPSKTNKVHTSEADHQNSSNFKSPCVPTVRTPIPDGYNWRKYGQKQVKSPTGSRSYYKCTYSDCCAKKIECGDHSGKIVEIVNKGNHNHDPPWKNNIARESKVALSSQPALQNSGVESSIITLKDSEQAASLQESIKEAPPLLDKKRQNSTGLDGNGFMQTKEEHVSEPQPKRRVKKEHLESAKTSLKPGKKSKFVVHAAGDVGISGDGYRWRKYGQKMVKGNLHPRNYYRCTSAGCPVRKHIETAVDNTSAIIITYKGVHDHDMPVPKKRHGPPSAPLLAAAAPASASMNNVQVKKTDAPQNQVKSTQWSVGKEGELTSETLDVGEDKKAIESARTLLSIGFEIKPC